MSDHVKQSGLAQVPSTLGTSGAKVDVEPKESSRLASLVRRICSLMRKVISCLTCGLLCKEADQPISNRPGANQLDSKNISTPVNAIPAQKTRLTEVLKGLDKVAPSKQLKRMQEAVLMLRNSESFAPGEKHAALGKLIGSLLSNQRSDNPIAAERFERIKQSVVRDLFDCITSGEEEDLNKELLERLLDKSISEGDVHKVRPEYIVEAVLQSGAPMGQDWLVHILIDSLEGGTDFLLLLEKHRKQDLDACKGNTEVFNCQLDRLLVEAIPSNKGVINGRERAFECAGKLSDLRFALNQKVLGNTLLNAASILDYGSFHTLVEFLRERREQDLASCGSKREIVRQLQKNIEPKEGDQFFSLDWVCLLQSFGYKPDSRYLGRLLAGILGENSVREDVKEAYLNLARELERLEYVVQYIVFWVRSLRGSASADITKSGSSSSPTSEQWRLLFCQRVTELLLEKVGPEALERVSVLPEDLSPLKPLKELLEAEPELKVLSDWIDSYREAKGS